MKNIGLYATVGLLAFGISTITTVSLVLYFGHTNDTDLQQQPANDDRLPADTYVESNDNSLVPDKSESEDTADNTSSALDSIVSEVQQYDAELDALYEQADPYLINDGLYEDVPEELRLQIDALRKKRNEASDRLREILD